MSLVSLAVVGSIAVVGVKQVDVLVVVAGKELWEHTQKKRIILIHFVDLPCELKYVCNTLTVLDIYLCHRDCTPGRLCWFWTHWTPGVRDKTFSKHRCCRSRLFSSGRRS